MWENDNYSGGDGGFIGNGSRKKNSIKIKKGRHYKRMFKGSRRRSRRSSDNSPIFDAEFLGTMFWFFLSTYLLFFGLFETPMIYLYVYIPLILIVIYLKNTKPLWDLMMGITIVSGCGCMILAALFLIGLIFDWNISVLFIGFLNFIGVPTANLILCKIFDHIFS